MRLASTPTPPALDLDLLPDLGLRPDLDLLRDALASSTLSHGLRAFGDRWTVAVLLGAFTGIRRFEAWQSALGIPRQTLTARLKSLQANGLLRQRASVAGARRQAYHLTAKALALYGAVLMMWAWERRWGAAQGTAGAIALPDTLVHERCGKPFVPRLQCAHCGLKTGVTGLRYALAPNARLLQKSAGPERAARLSPQAVSLRVDRWALMIVTAVVMGCKHFEELRQVLGIGTSVLALRLKSMVRAQLLLAQNDLHDARRTVYRLTPASRDLFGYIVCFSRWTGEHHLHEASSIQPMHIACGHAFTPCVACDQCGEELRATEVRFA